MHITLLHNPHAGGGTPSTDELRALIESVGHAVQGVLNLPEDDAELVVPDTELLVVAGGDGTVRAAAVSAAERDVPMAILPLGTANNLATSLGVEGALATLASSWHEGVFRQVDIGRVGAQMGEAPFLEGAGAGALADLVRSKASGPRELDRTARLARAWSRFEQELDAHVALEARLQLDDIVVEGSFVLLEVLNTPRVGPGVEFAPAADPGDGLLDVVVFRESAREAPGSIDPARISRHVERHRGSAVRVTVPACTLHVDGLARRTDGETWRAWIGPNRLRVLVPNGG